MKKKTYKMPEARARKINGFCLMQTSGDVDVDNAIPSWGDSDEDDHASDSEIEF